jgi:ankyrin repeat protein
MGDIFEATREGCEEEVMRLLDGDPLLLEGGHVHFGDRPLAWAALFGQLGVARLLMERGANINATGYEGKTALHHAAKGRNEELLALLLREKAPLNTRGHQGKTPLMLACINGRLGMVKMLVQHMGVQGLDDGDDRGWTAMHYAVSWGHPEVVRFLLLAGSDPTITNNLGRTPRALAERKYDRDTSDERCARCVAVFEVRLLAC